MGKAVPLVALLMLSTGCVHHQIAFDPNGSWHYAIEGPRIDVPIVAAVPASTQDAEQEISSAMTGIANRWHAQYGLMFMQALEVELSQLFSAHEIAKQCPADAERCLELDVSSYSFHDFAAHATVTARLRDASGQGLDESYSATGRSGAGKAIGLGAFGMKSAIRQSTLDAYEEIFAKLRVDLRNAIARAPAEAGGAAPGTP